MTLFEKKMFVFIHIFWLILLLTAPLAFAIIALIKGDWVALICSVTVMVVAYCLALEIMLPIIQEELQDIKDCKNCKGNLTQEQKKKLELVKKDLCQMEGEDMTLQDKIEKLIKNGWSFGKLAKELGVSKTSISRWHKGECKPSYPYYEENLDCLLQHTTQKENELLEPIDKLKLLLAQENYSDFMKILEKSKENKISIIDNEIKFHKQKLAELKAQKEKEKWKFTEDEKVILRNLPKEYNWLIRSQGGDLFVFTLEPQKMDYYWETINKGKDSYCEIISMFNHLFKCIQWSDEHPCEFRKYI